MFRAKSNLFPSIRTFTEMDRRTFLSLIGSALLLSHGLDAQVVLRSPIYPQATVQFFDDNGKPVAFGELCSFEPKSFRMKSVYQDARLQPQPWPHPNPVTLDHNGRAPIYLSPGGYRFVLLTPGSRTLCQQREITRKPSPVIRAWGDIDWTFIDLHDQIP